MPMQTTLDIFDDRMLVTTTSTFYDATNAQTAISLVDTAIAAVSTESAQTRCGFKQNVQHDG